GAPRHTAHDPRAEPRSRRRSSDHAYEQYGLYGHRGDEQHGFEKGRDVEPYIERTRDQLIGGSAAELEQRRGRSKRANTQCIEESRDAAYGDVDRRGATAQVVTPHGPDPTDHEGDVDQDECDQHSDFHGARRHSYALKGT